MLRERWRTHRSCVLLDETIELSRAAGATRLLGNSFELRGQVYFLDNDFARARANFKEALAIFQQSNSYDQLLIAKCQAVMEAQESADVTPLRRFREEAVRRQHFDSVRDSDLYILKHEFDQYTFDHLLFGTPMLAYRLRVAEHLPHEASDRFILGRTDAQVLNLQTGEMKFSKTLNPGKKVHQTIAALVRDFYVPRNMGSLVSELYPGEYFDVDTSPVRVRQILSRTRAWIEENNIAARIQYSRAGYSLQVTGDFGIEVEMKRAAPDSQNVHLRLMQITFAKDMPFTTAQACQVLELSRSGFHRLVGWAVENGALVRVGSGKATRYKVA